MKEFIQRNKGVILIGFSTLLVFLGIIVMSQKSPPNSPDLVQVEESKLIADHTYIKGNPESKVTIVEFSDYKCPACAQTNPVLEDIYQKNTDKMKIALRHYPLPQHAGAKEAAAAAQAAGEQNKFWEFSDELFIRQDEGFDREFFVKVAEDTGLDTEKFEQDLDDPKFMEQVDQDLQIARELGLNSTPTIFLNGKQMTYSSYAEFERSIREEILQASAGTETGENDEEKETALTPADEAKYPTLVINYTDSGFVPQTETGYPGQTVKWINNTDEEITLTQIDTLFDEFGGGRVILPGDSLEFTLYKDRMWRYEAEDTGDWGSIYIEPETIEKPGS